MKLKTILFFGAIAVAISAPKLFQNYKTGQNGQTTLGSQNSAGAFNGQPGNFATNPQNGRQPPFQFAGSQSPPPVTTMGNNVSTTPPTIYSSSMTWSEPVYQSFTNPREFLRFDISPAWVRERWPRVFVCSGEDKLTGMRVSLVSGPRPVDIHGSLTYYFNNHQQVQRITFKGWTGNAVEIAQTFEQLGFLREKTNGAALFVQRSWGKLKGVLRLDHPPVIRRELPNEQLMVLFEIVNPKSSLSVSGQTTTILDAMQ